MPPSTHHSPNSPTLNIAAALQRTDNEQAAVRPPTHSSQKEHVPSQMTPPSLAAQKPELHQPDNNNDPQPDQSDNDPQPDRNEQPMTTRTNLSNDVARAGYTQEPPIAPQKPVVHRPDPQHKRPDRNDSQPDRNDIQSKPSPSTLSHDPARAGSIQDPSSKLDFLRPSGSRFCQLGTILQEAVSRFDIEEKLLSNKMNISGLRDLYQITVDRHDVLKSLLHSAKE